MTTKMKAKSRIIVEVHDTPRDLHTAGFIDKRRQGAVETSEALITLQEAMQVMLDRVEAIDVGRMNT